MRGKAYDWFQSHLSNSKQFVCINGHKSDSLLITCGVPQGSTLGLLLFLLYINDLPNTSKLPSFHLFADDTNICCSRKNLNDLELIALSISKSALMKREVLLVMSHDTVPESETVTVIGSFRERNVVPI